VRHEIHCPRSGNFGLGAPYLLSKSVEKRPLPCRTDQLARSSVFRILLGGFGDLLFWLVADIETQIAAVESPAPFFRGFFAHCRALFFPAAAISSSFDYA
jgi:hypothetical protein